MKDHGRILCSLTARQCAFAALCAGLFIIGSCSRNSPFSLLPYKPVITFTGIVGPDSLYLPGSKQNPNTCRFDADTVRMYFYSEEFSQGPISSGDEMRIDIFSADSEFITKRHARLHFTRYDYGQNTCTFQVSPADTTDNVNNLTMHRSVFEWSGGGTVLLKDISASAKPLGAYCGQSLSIQRGVISGAIE